MNSHVVLLAGTSFESAGQLLRLLRLFRLLRLIRQFRSFKILWDAFVISVWPILNIFLLIFLFFWIYSVIGVSQFGHTRPGLYCTYLFFVKIILRIFSTIVFVVFRGGLRVRILSSHILDTGQSRNRGKLELLIR
jgi:hypothetical protein